MSKRAWQISLGILVIGSIALALIKIAFGLGFFLGGVIGLLNYKRNESFWTAVLESRQAGRGTGFSHFLVNYGLMASVLVLAALFPDYLNIFTAALGLMIVKIATVAETLYITR